MIDETDRLEWCCVAGVLVVTLYTWVLAWGMGAGNGLLPRWYWAENLLCSWFSRCSWPLTI